MTGFQPRADRTEAARPASRHRLHDNDNDNDNDLEDGEMFAAFLQATFRRLGGTFDELSAADGPPPACAGTVDQAVEHVVDQTAPRLRAVSGYARRLRGPVITALRAIDGIVEDIPGVLPCRRSTYGSDARVNAFFVNYGTMQEVFSHSKEVRDLFDTNAGADECFALLCMHREERRQFGMDVEGEILRKDVAQTAVSFTDHQLVSPGLDEADARCALKCCIFNSLIAHIRLESAKALTRADDLDGRAQAWRARLKRETPGTARHAELQREVDAIEAELRAPTLRLATLDDHFRYVADALANPQTLVSSHRQSIFVDRLGIKYDGPDAAARELTLSEVHVAGHRPRVASLVRFPRAELLPARDFVREASIFLAA
jgi:hypothetical protein